MFNELSKQSCSDIIIRNTEDLVLASTDRYIPNAFVAEAVAATQAMTFAADPGFMHVVSEGDSLTVIKKLKSPNEDRSKISGLFSGERIH